MVRIGLIADTHNLLRPAAADFLRGCDQLIHAGDIANAATLEQVAGIAPLTVVRGNNDQGAWALALPDTAMVDVENTRILVIHDLKDLSQDPRSLGVRVVISGHSHKPLIEERAGVLYVNPGSAGRRRFKLPVAVGELRLEGSTVSARIVELET